MATLGQPHAVSAATPTLSDTTTYWTQTGVTSSVKDITAQLGATIGADGGAAITERGIVWSTTDNTPTTGEPGVTTVVEGGTATGIFSLAVTGLSKAALTYFSGYATNAQGTSYSPVSTFYTEPDAAAAPTVTPPSGTNYFELTVNYTKPANADGILVVARPSYAPRTPPYDGHVYSANARVGAGDTTEPGCIVFCEYVVADDTGGGSVTVTGLKDNLNYYFTVYAYKGSGPGISGINYVQTITATGPVTTDTVPLAGKSHNELYVAQGGAGGIMTSADCANCHGVHHTSQLLPTGLDMYNKCFVCHQAGGTADPKINIGMHLADGSVDCGTCHSMHSFKEEELYSTDHLGVSGFNLSFVRANMAKYLNTTRGFAVNALEPTVFQNRLRDFAFASTDPPYNGVCQTCHSDDTRTIHHQQDATDDHNFGSDCTSCHAHKSTDQYNAFAPSGHPVDFGKDAGCTSTGCHTGAKVLEDIHGDGTSATCTLCHNAPPSRDSEKLGARGLGDATNADGTAIAGTWTSVTCVTCHDVTTPDPDLAVTTLGGMHHGHPNATGGDCVFCHQPDVGQTGADGLRINLSMPANLACNFCHLWWPNNKTYYTTATDNGYSVTGTSKVRVFRLNWDPNGTTQKTYAASSEVVSHSISENSTTPISDYAACFSCHGASAATKGGNFQVRPFHGFGPAVTGFEPLSGDSGTANVNIEWYAGPTSTGQDQPARTIPWHPGFAAFNWMNAEVRPVTGTKQFAIDTRNAHKLDWNKPWTTATRIGALIPTPAPISFAIPWDNYGPTPDGPTGTSDPLNTGGQTGAFTKQTTVPLVPLSLPTSITP